MEYLVEAKKFGQLAYKASHPEVIKQHLNMAEWCLTQAIKESDDASDQELRKSN